MKRKRKVQKRGVKSRGRRRNGEPRPDRSCGADRFSTPKAVLLWLIHFANKDIEAAAESEKIEFGDGLLMLSQYTPRMEESELQLREIRRQVWEILVPLAKRDLEHPIEGEPSHSLAHTPEDLSGVSFQWEREEDRVTEQFMSMDLRSGVLLRLRDAIAGLKKNFRLQRCRVTFPDGTICGRSFGETRARKPVAIDLASIVVTT
jgi:hypothetical protein